MQLQGQWFGKYEGTNLGHVILNLDKRPDGFSGSASIVENEQTLPSATYYMVLKPRSTSKATFVGHADLRTFFRQDGPRTEFLSREHARELYPNLRAEATRIALKGEFKNGFLSIDFATDAKTGKRGWNAFRLSRQLRCFAYLRPGPNSRVTSVRNMHPCYCFEVSVRVSPYGRPFTVRIDLIQSDSP